MPSALLSLSITINIWRIIFVETILKNPEEYSFCLDPTWDPDQIDPDGGMATLVRSTIGRGTLGSTGSQYGTMKSGAGTMKRNKAGDTATLQKKKNIKEQIGNKLIDMANAKYRIVGLTRQPLQNFLNTVYGFWTTVSSC